VDLLFNLLEKEKHINTLLVLIQTDTVEKQKQIIEYFAGFSNYSVNRRMSMVQTSGCIISVQSLVDESDYMKFYAQQFGIIILRSDIDIKLRSMILARLRLRPCKIYSYNETEIIEQYINDSVR
jgi:hypothetical protein